MNSESSFTELVEVMARLRAPNGCPWDREQTHVTLKPYLLEEAYEALEAIDIGDDDELCKELGDVLLQVVFHAQIATEENRFGIEEVARAIVDKLIRRHPHVFADVDVDGSEQVLQNWEQIKKQERQDQGQATPSLLDGIPKQLPALMRAQRMQARVSRQGFDWDQIAGPLDKVEEEFAELRQAWASGEIPAIEDEFGDLLFALVNTGRFLNVDPEQALRQSTDKFARRFRALEFVVRTSGREISALSLQELDAVWDEIKAREKMESAS
ncbi:MAG TPA: nucleoside triphosphate pyrophosphohydrolase [Candidatus Latescibacteria bacterium]|nr:nucleoside triphosphate pyrophosphohydrolase [Candidatus Latescibacterota bacterium]